MYNSVTVVYVLFQQISGFKIYKYIFFFINIPKDSLSYDMFQFSVFPLVQCHLHVYSI